ncbi:TatD family hydrolase [Candidatus Micrarchaeota archaeon]|nr:TatD family hydrolase [Candidatus Micrarchaeota archaeon]
MVVLVDAHCHLSDMKDYSPSKNVIPVASGYSHKSNLKTAEIAKRLGVPFSLGIAPQSVIGNADLDGLDSWLDFIKKGGPNAIGEIGLDYHWAKNDEDVKREELVFGKMLDLAGEMNLPVVIHGRKATPDIIDTFRMRKFSQPIMMHFFAGSVSEAKWVVEQGGFISTPPLHAKERRNAIHEVPLENLLVETDAPYVVRTPEQVRDAVSYIAEIKSLDFDAVAEQTAKNAHRFFNF